MTKAELIQQNDSLHDKLNTYTKQINEQKGEIEKLINEQKGEIEKLADEKWELKQDLENHKLQLKYSREQNIMWKAKHDALFELADVWLRLQAGRK